jgi:PAS domain S-box-containing protein
MEDEARRVLDTIPELIWTADPAGHVDFVNRRWCEYTGMTVEEADRGEASAALVAHTAMAHRGGEPGRRTPRGLSRSRRRKIRFAAIQRIDKCS